ncbi:hypothetical protein HZA97_04840 [Candidatus Woesearchaeota archaeon]|nr:hypothetical protein [Candidatus Woesearchaeota archaeon]
MKLYPSPFSNSISDFEKKVKLVKKEFTTLHVDIIDNKFVKNKILSLKQLRKIPQQMNYSFHLMVYNPEKYIKQLKKFRVKEVFIHCEAVNNLDKAISMFKKNKLGVGIAWNPETKVEKHLDDLKKSNEHLIMTIHPGASGRKLLLKTLEKIKKIRKHNKKAKITIDGGINFKTIKEIKKYKPDVIAVTSGIFKGDIKENIRKWHKILS